MEHAVFPPFPPRRYHHEDSERPNPLRTNSTEGIEGVSRQTPPATPPHRRPSSPRFPRKGSDDDMSWDTSWVVPSSAFERPQGGWAGSEVGMEEPNWVGWRKHKDKITPDSVKFFPHPSVSLPPPVIKFDFRMAVRLNCETSKIEGPGAVCKEVTLSSGGSWSGSFGSGLVVAGGHDLKIPDLNGRPGSKIDTAFRLQTNDDPPAFIEMRTRGYLAGDSELLGALISQRTRDEVDPRQYYFRMFMTLRSRDERYAEDLNFAMWVGSGMWKGEELIFEIT